MSATPSPRAGSRAQRKPVASATTAKVNVYRNVTEGVWRDISSVFYRRFGDVAGIMPDTISLTLPDVKETCAGAIPGGVERVNGVTLAEGEGHHIHSFAAGAFLAS
jgi:hypothetical protein